MRTDEFEFTLPAELIAQQPAKERDQSRLLVFHRDTGSIEHRCFCDIIQFIRAGDVLVLNNSRVIPARLRGVSARTGGEFEILLLEQNEKNDWWALVRPGRRARVGTQIILLDHRQRPSEIRASAVAINEEGHRRFRFEGTEDVLNELETLGETPLPPYIRREDSRQSNQDRERYQTIFARQAGSVAAPTAGLHFTEALLERIRSRGATICYVTLHVGVGTFTPVKSETISGHRMHEERYDLSGETARIISAAKADGRRVIAVGTTTVRVLESVAAENNGALAPRAGRTKIFIHPPFTFKIVDALLTNFHLPRSTLLMLVSAFAATAKINGRDTVLAAYAEAVRERYRFFSYGDAMLLL